MSIDIENYSFYRGDKFTGSEDPRYSDRSFIVEQLEKIPFRYRAGVMEKYSKIYSEKLTESESAARNECNSRLRAAVENINGNSSFAVEEYR